MKFTKEPKIIRYKWTYVGVLSPARACVQQVKKKQVNDELLEQLIIDTCSCANEIQTPAVEEFLLKNHEVFY